MRIVLIGGGGHASDVLEALESSAQHRGDMSRVIGFVDDTSSAGHHLASRGVNHLGPVSNLPQLDATHFVLATGWPRTRRSMLPRLEGSGLEAVTVSDPGARIEPSARLGVGAVVLWGAHVSANVDVGQHALISHGALVGHDCSVGDLVSIFPGAAIGGATSIGSGCTIGANATVRDGLSIGEDATVAAGAVAVRDVPPGVTAIGVPARW